MKKKNTSQSEEFQELIIITVGKVAKSSLLAHIYMTANFPGLAQALRKDVGLKIH